MLSTTREFPLTDEMKRLLNITRVHAEGKTLFVENAQAEPITCPYTGELSTTLDGLKQALIDNRFEDKLTEIDNLIRYLSDEWRKQEEEKSASSNKDANSNTEKPYYIHKYSKGIPLVEAVIVAGQPRFIQMKEGSDLDFDLLSELPMGNRLLKPRDIHSYLCEPYVFEFKEKIRDYLKLASKKSTNLNFDQIFKLVKTIFMKYVVLEDHYITLLAADVIYSYFQDLFGTTHYVICIGDNGSGKNSILMTFASLGYRVLLATSVSAANVYTFLGSIDECQGTIAEDEINNLDNDPDKLNIYKSGYCRGSGRIPKIDLKSGRTQEVFNTYCFKIFASESSLDNSKAKGLRDRSFEILCLVGKPQHNIKDVYDKNNEQLRNELVKTRKLLFAYRMCHHGDTMNDVSLNIINREAELTKPLIRLFHDSPGVKKELLSALSKCLDAKRKVKSNSLEAILYTAICNLIPEHGYTIDNQSIIAEVKGITDGVDIENQQAFYCQDLGKITHRKITDTLVDKFKAERVPVGRDKDKKRGLRFTKENLDRKGIEYDVPDEIKILPTNQEISSGPDSFDSILLEDKMGTQGTQGTLGTVLEGVDEGTNEIDVGQIDKDTRDSSQSHEAIQDTENVIKTENGPTHPLEASPPSPPSPQLEGNDANNTEEKPSVIAVKSSPSMLSISLDSNDRDESNRLEQLFICPHCPKFKSTLESEYQRHIVLKHPRKPGYPNTAVAGVVLAD
ncbi:MAG: hypothetical protein WBF33_14385 [Candidatus Nitrosopolaris sp.]